MEKKGGWSSFLIIIFSVFAIVMYFLQLLQDVTNPFPFPDIPLGQIYEGGVTALLIICALTLRSIPNQLNEMRNKLDGIDTKIDKLIRDLLGSLKDTYDDFRDELRERLTTTS